jgi:hypothetical protein
MARRPGGRIVLLVYARAIDDAAGELRELRFEEWQELGLGALALAFAVGATQFYPPLALPSFLGGLVVGLRGIRALWRRWDIVDRLAGERDAYVIPDVLSYAIRETTMERRRDFAGLLRNSLAEPREPRIDEAAEELDSLARDLENEGLRLDPASAIACTRLLNDYGESPLLNPELPPEDLRARVNHIHTGFAPMRSETTAA